MAKLTDEALSEGRRWVSQCNVGRLMGWIRENADGVFTEETLQSMEKTYGLCFRAGDSSRALKLFNKTFEGMDPQAEVAAKKVKLWGGCGCALFMGLGLLGGVVYLFRSLFGL
jgi:hypothetical protein